MTETQSRTEEGAEKACVALGLIQKGNPLNNLGSGRRRKGKGAGN